MYISVVPCFNFGICKYCRNALSGHIIYFGFCTKRTIDNPCVLNMHALGVCIFISANNFNYDI